MIHLLMALQVHADASTFSEGITKEEAYQQVLDQAEGLFFEQRNWVRRYMIYQSKTYQSVTIRVDTTW